MSNEKSNNNILIMILIAVIFVGVGFFTGTKYQQSQTRAQRTQLAGQFGNRGAGGVGGVGGTGRTGGFRGGQVLGDIISVDSKTITVKLADGSSKIILFSDTTSINQASTATVSDLKVGSKVSAFGTANSDGSVTAQSIQLNPISRELNTAPTPTK